MKAVRKIGLIDITGCNVLLATAHVLTINRVFLFRCKRQATEIGPMRVDPVRLCQSGFEFGQAIPSFAKQLFPRFTQKSFKRWTEHEHQTVQLVIDCRDEIEKSEFQIRRGKVITSQGRQLLELACEIITQVADGAPEKRWNIGRTN